MRGRDSGLRLVNHTDTATELYALHILLPPSLLRSIRLYAALGAMTLDDFVREAIEERLRG